MKCPTCRTEMMAEVVETYDYTESGLENVLLHGITVRHCPNGHDRVVSLPRVAELHQVITRAISDKHGKLTGHYTKGDLERALHDAVIQGYKPATSVATVSAIPGRRPPCLLERETITG